VTASRKRSIKFDKISLYHDKLVKKHRDYVKNLTTTFRLILDDFSTKDFKIVYVMRSLAEKFKKTWYRFEKQNLDHEYIFKKYCEHLLDLIKSFVNRHLHHAQLFSNAKQEKKQSMQAFDAFLNNLENQLTSYIEKQRIIHLFIKFRSKLRAALTNYQNLFIIKKELLILTNRLKNNMKKTIDVQTTFDNRSSNFKTSFKKKWNKDEKRENKNSFNDKIKMKNRRKNIDEKKWKRSNHSHLICHKCNEIKHIVTNCFDLKKKFKINAIFNKFKRSKIFKKKEVFNDDWSIVEDEESIKFEINSAQKMLVNDAQTAFVKFVDDQSTRKSMKSVSIIIIQKIIVILDTKHFNKILLNENTKINVINYRYAIAHDMTSIDNDFSISSHVERKSIHCYDAYNVRIRLVDSWKQKRVFETMFYVLNKNEMSNMILELSKLKQIETKLNYQMFIWRYDFSKQILKISSINDFAKKINHHDFIYVVMIQSYKSDTKIKINAVSTFVENVDDSAKKIFFEFRKFDDVFSLKNEKILASHKKNVDHVIKLKNDK
jgi:hypothetical protein